MKVEDDCTLPGHPEVFVIGDLMNLGGLPGVSQVAIQSGRHAADTIRRRLAGDTTRRPFRYRDFGTMATISRFRALAAIGRVRLAGFPAWVLWLVVHLAALTGFKHRLSVFFNWTVGLLGGGRAERVITLQQVFGRHAMAAHTAVVRSDGEGLLTRGSPAAPAPVVHAMATERRPFPDHSPCPASYAGIEQFQRKRGSECHDSP